MNLLAKLGLVLVLIASSREQMREKKMPVVPHGVV